MNHLHIHTEYSALDGMITSKALVEHCNNNNMKAVAITDHGTLAAIHPFFQELKKSSIKPIVGLEAYIEEEDESISHLVLLARNETGYKNLLKLNLEGYRNRRSIFGRIQARIKHNIIPQYGEGLIGLSACSVGRVAKLLRQDKTKQAIDYVRNMQTNLDHFFLEVQAHDAMDQLLINEKVLDLAKQLGDISVVATTDAHYLNKNDYDIHDMLLAIQEKKKKDSQERNLQFGTQHLYVKTHEEMVRFLKRTDVVNNTQEVVDLCEYPHYLELNAGEIPDVVSPKGTDSKTYLRQLCETALCKRKKDQDQEYRDRLEMELKALDDLNMNKYMLCVYDYCKWARENNILLGSRGSVGGCLAAYLLDITQVDPIRYHLIFERFANADRVSKGDIDVDFAHTRREEVKQYLFKRYGEERSVVIATVDRMKAKATLQDVARSLGIDTETRNRITKSIIDNTVTLKEARKIYPEFDKAMEEHSELWEYSSKLEGIIRQSGVHAGGVLISNYNLTDTIPLKIQDDRAKKSEIVATEYDMDTVEALGLEKFDVLASANLTIVGDTINLIKARNKEFKGFYLRGVPFTDENQVEKDIEACTNELEKQASKAYQLLRNGNTEGIFQLAGTGMKTFLGQVGVNSIEDIGVVLALHRPGPLESGNAYSYVRRRRGDEAVEVIHPSLKPVLAKTYGVPVFQEDIMRIAQQVAGMPMSGADTFRKSIGKKIPELMRALRDDFVSGCISSSGLTNDEAIELFESIESFAGYAFNGAHSIGYALTAFKTAFLKANYPAEYMASLLSNEAPNSDDVSAFIRDTEKMGINVIASHVNDGALQYKVISDNTIMRPLLAIKGVGEKAVQAIIDNQPYSDLFDFINKMIAERAVKVNIIEILIKAGALDCFGYTRLQLFEDIREIITLARKERKKNRVLTEWTFSTNEEWDEVTSLSYERDVWGEAVSDSLFSTIKARIKPEVELPLSQLSILPVGRSGYVLALIKSVTAQTKIRNGPSKGKVMKVLEIEDRYRGSSSLVVWPNVAEKKLADTEVFSETIQSVLGVNSMLLLHCRVTKRYKSTEKQLELLDVKKVFIEEIDW